VLLICLVVPIMYVEENRRKLHFRVQKDITEPSCELINGGVLHLSSYYISVCLNFVIHFLTLILCLMMLRFDENRDYELVATV
jgi:hypothetical protein